MNLNLNLKEFLKYIKPFRWLIVIVPILFCVIAYVFLKNAPNTYKSEALIATGITQQVQQVTLANMQSSDNFKLSQQFANMLQLLQSKKLVHRLSYRLVLHDLENESRSFTPYPSIYKDLSSADKQAAIDSYKNMLIAGTLISPDNNKGSLKLYDVLEAFGYDEESIIKNLSVFRNGESDFIKVGFTSHNPQLSAFAVNNLSTDFINYYINLGSSSQRASIKALDTLLNRKQQDMAEKNAKLQDVSSKVAQAQVAQRKTELENEGLLNAQNQKTLILTNISALEGSIRDVNAKLSGDGGYVKETNNRENAQIVNLDNQIALANQRYANSNFKPEYKNAIDSLQNIKLRLIGNLSSSSNANSAVLKQELMKQKIKLETDLVSAKNSLSTLNQRISNFEIGAAASVGTAAVGTATSDQQLLINKADLASKEFSDAKTLYDQSKFQFDSMSKLNIAEPGLPGSAEPSKKMLYLGFSGISGFMMCIITLFVLFMFNRTISTSTQLEIATKQKVIGSLNYLSDEGKDLRNIWNNNTKNGEYEAYKELLRSLRFDLSQQLSADHNVLGVVSLKPGEGKTFLANSIVYAMAKMGKNVLLICDDKSDLLSVVTNQSRSKTTPGSRRGQKNDSAFENFLVKKEIQVEDNITILKRKESETSLLEMKDSKSLISGFDILKKTFDVIVIDIDSFNDLYKVKEWLMFCDKSICVFGSGNTLQAADMPFVEFLSAQNGFLGWIMNKTKIFKN